MNVAEELPIVSKVSYTNFGNNSINAPSNFVESAKRSTNSVVHIFAEESQGVGIRQRRKSKV